MNVAVGGGGIARLRDRLRNCQQIQEIIGAHVFNGFGKARLYVSESVRHKPLSGLFVSKVEGRSIDKMQGERPERAVAVEVKVYINRSRANVRSTAAAPLNELCDRSDLVLGRTRRDIEGIEQEPQEGSLA